VSTRLNVAITGNDRRDRVSEIRRAGAVLARLLAVGVEGVVLPGNEGHDGRLLDAVVRQRVDLLPARDILGGEVLVLEGEVAAAAVPPLEVDLVDRRSQRVGRVLVQGVQDLEFHLTNGVTVQHLALNLLVHVLLHHVQRLQIANGILQLGFLAQTYLQRNQVDRSLVFFSKDISIKE